MTIPVTLTHGMIHGRLASGISHDFSYIVCCEAGDVEKYYEVKPAYHHQYPSTKLFKRWWRNIVRRRLDAAEALTKRARAVIGRSSIQPLRVKYMTTVNRYVHEDPNCRDEGVLRRQRHIIELTLSWADFDALDSCGHLRETEIHKAKFAKVDHQLWYIMDLTPFLLIREKMPKCG